MQRASNLLGPYLFPAALRTGLPALGDCFHCHESRESVSECLAAGRSEVAAIHLIRFCQNVSLCRRPWLRGWFCSLRLVIAR